MRISCPSAQSKLVSPSGRDVAQRQRGLESADMAFQICPDTNLSACCPLSHLLRKCQLSRRESLRSQCEFVCSYAQSKLVSPFGRDVAQRQRGLIPADMAFPICPDTNLSACCPLSHLLRKCQLSQGESRETGAGFFLLRTNQTCLSLWERCRAATERADTN